MTDALIPVFLILGITAVLVVFIWCVFATARVRLAFRDRNVDVCRGHEPASDGRLHSGDDE